MLEDKVADVLQAYLGEYVKGLSKEALRISAWKGDLELKNLELKTDAFHSLNLPVDIVSGFVGSVKIKIPWHLLGLSPIVVFIEKVFILVKGREFPTAGTYDSLLDKKRSAIKESEDKLLQASNAQKTSSTREIPTTWIGAIANLVVANLRFSVSDVHIRIDDGTSCGRAYSAGVTLKSLLISNIGQNDKEASTADGTQSSLKKKLDLESLSVYLVPTDKTWGTEFVGSRLEPQDWCKLFLPAIHGELDKDKGNVYLLKPIHGRASYTRNEVRGLPAVGPLQELSVELDEVSLGLSEAQYIGVMRLADQLSSAKIAQAYALARPKVPVTGNAKAWWKYANQAITKSIRKKAGVVSWRDIIDLIRLRNQYVTLYAKHLREKEHETFHGEQVDFIESELDVDVLVQWRMLARRLSNIQEVSVSESEWSRRSLGPEEWAQLSQAVGYEEGMENPFLPRYSIDDVPHTQISLTLRRSGILLTDDKGQQVVHLTFREFFCDGKLFSRMMKIEAHLVGFCAETAQGMLIQSTLQEGTSETVKLESTINPSDQQVHWSVVVKACAARLVFHKESVKRIIEFFENKDAVTPSLALNSAAAFQKTLDDVAGAAQRNLEAALRSRSRFILDLDIEAPKLLVPFLLPDEHSPSQLLIDFGRLKIASASGPDADPDTQYVPFSLELFGVSAAFVDGSFDWSLVDVQQDNVHRLVDQCGIIALLEQAWDKDSIVPLTKIAVQLPFLGFHFSPGIHHRLMATIEAVTEVSRTEKSVVPWDNAEWSGPVQILSWKGVVGLEPTWIQRHAALAGSFLYILSSRMSRASKQRISLIAKQAVDVRPEEIGGARNVLAIFDSDQRVGKVLESGSAFIFKSENSELFNSFKYAIRGAIFQSSAPAATWDEGDPVLSKELTSSIHRGPDSPIVYFQGEVSSISFILVAPIHPFEGSIFSAKEVPLVQVDAQGGHVELVLLDDSDILLGFDLETLEIQDLILQNGGEVCSFLARTKSWGHQHFRQGESFSGLYPEGVQQQDSEDLPTLQTARSMPTSLSLRSTASEYHDAWEQLPSELSGLRTSSIYRCDSVSAYHDAADEMLPLHGFGNSASLSFKPLGLLPHSVLEQTDESSKEEKSSFLRATFTSRHSWSPDYEGVDMQLNLELSSLSFFFNRTTIMALTNATFDMATKPVAAVQIERDPCPQNESAAGFLGYGKERTVLRILVHLRNTQITFNKDNGPPLALLTQDEMHLDIKVHPNSFAIFVDAGQLRICDLFLGVAHPFGWMFTPATGGFPTSFVNLQFVSFNEHDPDYHGHDFALSATISDVSITFLNRFIQEVVDYVMGLISALSQPRPNQETENVQAVQQPKPAVMSTDLCFGDCILVVPKSSHDSEFLELRLNHITLKNSFTESKHALIEVMAVQVHGLHIFLGSSSSIGQDIVKNVDGLLVTINRPLGVGDQICDFPQYSISTQLAYLAAEVSDEELWAIFHILIANLSEAPASCSNQDFPLPIPAGSEACPSSRTDKEQATFYFVLDAKSASLTLFLGSSRDSPLATMEISNAWISYAMFSSGKSVTRASLEQVTLTDLTLEDPSTRQVVLSGMNMGESQGSLEVVGVQHSSARQVKDPCFMLLVLDYTANQSSSDISVRLQHPRLLLVPRFIKAFLSFLTPRRSEEASESLQGCLPFGWENAFHLRSAVYKQTPQTVVHISPQKPLVADGHNQGLYIYDGRGGILRLLDAKGNTLQRPSGTPIIFVGDGKVLQFKNVQIQGGQFLDSCIRLGIESSYSAAPADGVVFLSAQDTGMGEVGNESDTGEKADSGQQNASDISVKIQAIGVEVVVADKSDLPASGGLPEKALHAKLTAFMRFHSQDLDLQIEGLLRSLIVQTGSRLPVLNPIHASFKYASIAGSTSAVLEASELSMSLSFKVLRLIMTLTDQLDFWQPSNKDPVTKTLEFDRIAHKDCGAGQMMTIWRPRPPPGFASVGDCITAEDHPPSIGSCVLRVNKAWSRRPLTFKLVWSSPESECTDIDGDGLSIWEPVAPDGFCSFGHVAARGHLPPTSASVVCVRQELAAPTHIRGCMVYGAHDSRNEDNLVVWRVMNSHNTFMACRSEALAKAQAFEIRQPRAVHSKIHTSTCASESSSGLPVAHEKGPPPPYLQGCGPLAVEVDTVLVYELTNQEDGSCTSIWRPVCNPGFRFVGDVATVGCHEAPKAVVFGDLSDGKFAPPVRYICRGCYVQAKGGKHTIRFWYPVPPPGFSSGGCVVSSSHKPPKLSALACVRNDVTVGVGYHSPPISLKSASWECALWKLKNKAATFHVTCGNHALRVPEQMAIGISSADINDITSALSFRCSAPQFSISLFDDFGGLMAPVIDTTFSELLVEGKMSANGQEVSLSSQLVTTVFNSKLEVWEPIVEPMQGLVRYTWRPPVHNENSNAASLSTISLVSVLPVDVNGSVANMNHLLEAYASWNHLCVTENEERGQLYNRSHAVSEESDVDSFRGSDLKAGNEFNDGGTYVVKQNKTGMELFVRVVNIDGEATVLPIASGRTALLSIPPRVPKLDPSTAKVIPLPGLHFVAVLIGDIQVHEDLADREYFCTLELEQQQNEFPAVEQKACTRGQKKGQASSSEGKMRRLTFNELFAFQIEPGASEKLRLTVREVASGVSIGKLEWQLEDVRPRGWHRVTARLSSLHSGTWPAMREEWFSLRAPAATNSDVVQEASGKISLSHHFFITDQHGRQVSIEEFVTANKKEEPGSVFVGFSPHGPWSEVGYVYATDAVPWQVHGRSFAVEVALEEGMKTITARSLVVVENATNCELDVSLVPEALLQNETTQKSVDSALGSQDDSAQAGGQVQVEEMFEQQRYIPLAGWSSSYLLPQDPKHWSNRTMETSHKNFPEPKLPTGWEWTSGWHLQLSSMVDHDGWAYYRAFNDSSWPPRSHGHSKPSTMFVVRRRCWLRFREFCPSSLVRERILLDKLEPSSSVPVPLPCLSNAHLDLFLQVRPSSSLESDQAAIHWGPAQLHSFGDEPSLKRHAVAVNSLKEMESFVTCPSSDGRTSRACHFVFKVYAKELRGRGGAQRLLDWKVRIEAPLLVENLLPQRVKVRIRGPKDAAGTSLEEASLEQGASHGFTRVNPRDECLMQVSLTGHWKLVDPDKELLAHSRKQLENGIILVNAVTERRLKVSVSGSWSTSGSVQKIFRLFVPSWISVVGCPPITLFIKKSSSSHISAACFPISSGTSARQVETIRPAEATQGPVMLSSFADTMVMSASLEDVISGISCSEISFREICDQGDGFHLQACDSHGLSFLLYGFLDLVPLGKQIMKVINLRPFIVFTNRTGETLHLRTSEEAGDTRELLASDWRVWKVFAAPAKQDWWKDGLLLQVKKNSTEWSFPFSTSEEGSHVITVRDKLSGRRTAMLMEVQPGYPGSRFTLAFRLHSRSFPCRVENRSTSEVAFRQSGLEQTGWDVLKSKSTCAYAWEDPQGDERIELRPSGHPPTQSVLIELKNGSIKENLTFLAPDGQRETLAYSGWNADDGTFVLLIQDADPDNLSIPPLEDSQGSKTGSEMMDLHVDFNLRSIGMSFIDQRPQEIAYILLQGVSFSYELDAAIDLTKMKLLLQDCQVDNQLPLSPLPVLLKFQGDDDSRDCRVKVEAHFYNHLRRSEQEYPFLSAWVTNKVVQVSIHEPILWRFLEFLSALHLDRATASPNGTSTPADPNLYLGEVSWSGARVRLTVEPAPGSRPEGLLGSWGPLVSAAANTKQTPIRFQRYERHEKHMKRSELLSHVLRWILKDVLHQPLRLLSGVDLLGIVSSGLMAFSDSSREILSQSSEGHFNEDFGNQISGVGEGFLYGLESAAKGLVRGITSIPLETKFQLEADGLVGLPLGLVKGIAGTVIFPVSGLLGGFSLVLNGVEATANTVSWKLSHAHQSTPVRCPRAIGADQIVRPYNAATAVGQLILYLAEAGSYFGKHDIFRDHSKFALSDKLVQHFVLPDNCVVLITDKRVVLVKCPSLDKLKVNTKEPLLVNWDVSWTNVLALETVGGKDGRMSLVVIHVCHSDRRLFQKICCPDEAAAGSILRMVSQALKVFSNDDTLRDSFGVHSQGSSRLDRNKSIRTSRSGRSFSVNLFGPIESLPLAMTSVESACDVVSRASLQSQRAKLNLGTCARVWASNDNGSTSPQHAHCGRGLAPVVSVWRALPPEGFVHVGDVLQVGQDPPEVTVYQNSDNFSLPVGFKLIWRNDAGRTNQPVSIWKPIPPDGFEILGCVAVNDFREPSIHDARGCVRCVRRDALRQASLTQEPLWSAQQTTRFPWGCFLFGVESGCHNFFAFRDKGESSDSVCWEVADAHLSTE